MKIFLLIFILLFSSSARENPFFPSEGEKDIPITNNKQEITPPLKRAALSLPSKARLIKKVSVTYENLDGSIEEKSIELDNSIDWHLPLFISQNFMQSEKKEEPVKEVKKESEEFVKIASIKFIDFYMMQKVLKISTQDSMIRSFLLVNPHRIVCDFKADRDFKSYIRKINKGFIKKIRVGNHLGYYRVVIELDGYYRYKLKRSETSYEFELL